ncbi:MAG: hypothetical protein HKN54_10130 [Flavobacteriaceae bacterium]|nr:hypothetical protein [Flavobacteriaceae bacterium]
MEPKCPNGWKLAHMPSTPASYSHKLDDTPSSIWHGKRTNRVVEGVYRWEKIPGVLATQGNCSVETNFTGSFEIEKGSEHSINIGGIFNLGSEARELQGGYSYSWSNSAGQGSGLEESFGDECWEYLATPIVLGFTICNKWTTKGLSMRSILIGLDRKRISADYPFKKSWAQSVLGTWRVTECETPLYLRGGLMICKKWCCDGAPPD